MLISDEQRNQLNVIPAPEALNRSSHEDKTKTVIKHLAAGGDCLNLHDSRRRQPFLHKLRIGLLLAAGQGTAFTLVGNYPSSSAFPTSSSGSRIMRQGSTSRVFSSPQQLYDFSVKMKKIIKGLDLIGSPYDLNMDVVEEFSTSHDLALILVENMPPNIWVPPPDKDGRCRPVLRILTLANLVRTSVDRLRVNGGHFHVAGAMTLRKLGLVAQPKSRFPNKKPRRKASKGKRKGKAKVDADDTDVASEEDTDVEEDGEVQEEDS